MPENLRNVIFWGMPEPGSEPRVNVEVFVFLEKEIGKNVDFKSPQNNIYRIVKTPNCK
jgi:hypothetical protein